MTNLSKIAANESPAQHTQEVVRQRDAMMNELAESRKQLRKMREQRDALLAACALMRRHRQGSRMVT